MGETLLLTIEDGNAHDTNAVVSCDEGGCRCWPCTTCGVARVFYFFIRHGGSISCEITGHRSYGCGLEVPCCYKLTGKPKYIRRAKDLLKNNFKQSQFNVHCFV